MTESLMSCGISGWLGMALISGVGFLTMFVLLLAAAALGRYLISGSLKA